MQEAIDLLIVHRNLVAKLQPNHPELGEIDALIEHAKHPAPVGEAPSEEKITEVNRPTRHRVYAKSTYTIVDFNKVILEKPDVWELALKVNRLCGGLLADETSLDSLFQFKEPQSPQIWKETMFLLTPSERSFTVGCIGPLRNPNHNQGLITDLGQLRNWSFENLVNSNLWGMGPTRATFDLAAFRRNEVLSAA